MEHEGVLASLLAGVLWACAGKLDGAVAGGQSRGDGIAAALEGAGRVGGDRIREVDDVQGEVAAQGLPTQHAAAEAHGVVDAGLGHGGGGGHGR